MTKYLKHPASEKLFPRINSYLLRRTSTLLIYQNLVKAIIVHHSTDATGTVRKDPKVLPKNVVNAKLNKGERKTAYSAQYNAICMQWKERDVCMLSPCIPNENFGVV